MTTAFTMPPVTSSLFHPAGSQRILSLYFPTLATDRIARRLWGRSWRSRGRPDHPPIVCATRTGNAVRLTAVDTQAYAAGLRIGQGVAPARAMIPDLDVIPAEPEIDRSFLSGIADWCDRYTPLVALDGDQGLFLDITGCAHLFGGEKALFSDVLSRLFHMGLEVRGAISSAPGLSSAVARYSRPDIIGPEGAREALTALPVKALRLGDDVAGLLIKAGLRKIGDLFDQPRAPLARRFGHTLMLRLDQALGLEEEPISPRRPIAALSAERRLAEPVGDEDSILHLLGRLGESLKLRLEEQGDGGKLFELLLFRVDGRVFSITAGTAKPLRDPARITALFRARLTALHDDVDAGYGFETVRLNIVQSAPMAAVQPDFEGRGQQDEALATFIDQMTARFGEGMLTVPVAQQSHVPERASWLVPITDIQPVKALPQPSPSARPIRLFSHPEPVETTAEVPEGAPRTFRWRRTVFKVARAEGPERIAPEWWIDGEAAPSRDYFRIEDDVGRRYWLYREGLYERETSNPRWFMHGVFA